MNINKITRDDIMKMSWSETDDYIFRKRISNLTDTDTYALNARRMELRVIDGINHEIVYSFEMKASRNKDGRWFCSCGELLDPYPAPQKAMSKHITLLGR